MRWISRKMRPWGPILALQVWNSCLKDTNNEFKIEYDIYDSLAEKNCIDGSGWWKKKKQHQISISLMIFWIQIFFGKIVSMFTMHVIINSKAHFRPSIHFRRYCFISQRIDRGYSLCGDCEIFNNLHPVYPRQHQNCEMALMRYFNKYSNSNNA